jgi:methylphosphotriester-DNA--protein-cysteine methyltransferase
LIKHSAINNAKILKLVKQHKICFGGNEKLKIYGTLRCKAGKRIKKENRVFFVSENEAIQHGYRPCGLCMKQAFQKWKANQN